MPILSALFAPLLKYIAGGLLIACLILGGLWQIEKRGHAKANARIVQLTAKLNEISTKRNEQQIVTRDRIKTVTRTIHDADGRAKVVEAAPLPGECVTPPEILKADL